MKNLLKGFQDCNRLIVADLSCIDEDRVLEAATLTINAALLLSRSIRRDTCLLLYMPLAHNKNKNHKIMLLFFGLSLRGYRPDLGSAAGFIRNLLKKKRAKGAYVVEDKETLLNTLNTYRKNCIKGEKHIGILLAKPYPADELCKNICIFFDSCTSRYSVWWEVSTLNVLIDRCRDPTWRKRMKH